MKTSVDQLAVFGGMPEFTEEIHVGRPNICHQERLMARIKDALDRGWLTNDGPFVAELEQRIADMIGVKHCVTMCNGTVALEIAIRAIGLTGEVIVPSFTFVATAHALQWQEIVPVFCDIDPKTHNIDTRRVEAMITPRTTGIIGVHMWGRPCAVEALTAIAQGHRLKLLFDASHAFACSHQGHMVGNFGNAEVFSFHATKFFNTFEGGAVVTNDDDLAAKIHLMKNFGFAGYDDVIYIGTNGKMNEVSAAMGLTGLESLDEFIAANQANYRQYQRELSDISGVQLVIHDESEECNYQYIVLEIDEAETQISRDQMIEILHAENVLARRYFYPGCHRMEPYRSYFPNAGLLLPETEKLSQRVLSLPTGTAVSTKKIREICQIIHLVMTHGPEVRRKFIDQATDDAALEDDF